MHISIILFDIIYDILFDFICDMGADAVDSEAQTVALASAEYPAIPATRSRKSRPAYIAIPKISKTLVSYIVELTDQ